MPAYTHKNATQSAAVFLSLAAFGWAFTPSTALSQDTYVYPQAYYGRGSTVYGDYLRGQAAVAHAYGAQYFAASMLAQQRAALNATLYSQYQQATILESQAERHQEALKRIESLEARIDQLIQENTQLRQSLTAPREGAPAKEPDAATSELSEQLAKVQLSNPQAKTPKRRR